MVSRAFDLSVQKVGTEGHKVQDQPWVHSETLSEKQEKRGKEREGRENCKFSYS